VINLKRYNIKKELKDEVYMWGSALKELVKENKREIGIYALELAAIVTVGEGIRYGLSSWMESLGQGPHNIGGNAELYNNLKLMRDSGVRIGQVATAAIHPVAKGLKKGVDYLRRKEQK